MELFEVHETKHSVYLIMEYLSGGTVLGLTTKKHSEAETSQILRQVIKCVEFCHNKRIMHRDIKPDNLMMKKPGDFSSIKIIDFGLA